MKRFTSFIIILLSVIGALTISSYASVVKRAIPSARITIKSADIALGSGSIDDPMSYVSVPENNYYEFDSAVWLDDIATIRVGDRPRMKVYLQAIPKESSHSNYDLIYLFSGSYTKNNVTVTKGELEKAEVTDSGYFLEVTIKLNAINGSFDPPESAEWISPTGTARWEDNPNDSGYHDIQCLRGGTTVKSLKNYRGSSYNFYPYMTKAGDYKIKIRTVQDPNSKVGKTSDWTESDVLTIEEDQVSDGTGQTHADENGGGQNPVIDINTFPAGTGNSATVGWVNQNGYTYFFYPNGEYQKAGWMKFDEKWYMFDESGHRLTGWQKNKYGKWFYLDPQTGVMKTGWLKDKDNWYFLDTTPGDTEGRMVTGWLTWKNEKYYFNSSGVMVTGWYSIDGSYRYFYPEGSKEGGYGYMARNTRVGDFSFDENGIWK